MKIISMSKRYIKIIKPYFKNKYFITAFVFFLWMLFFDNNSLSDRSDLNKKFKLLNKTKDYYINKIKEDSKRLNELKTNDKNLEKFAREQYYMKKANEDVFIVKEDNL